MNLAVTEPLPVEDFQLVVASMATDDERCLHVDFEQNTDEVFERRNTGRPLQNTFPRYSQAGFGWARCYWCWQWKFSIGHQVGVGEVADPLCDRCRDLNEPPWYPNNRQRAVLYFQHTLSRHEYGYALFFKQQAEALAAYLANPGEP